MMKIDQILFFFLLILSIIGIHAQTLIPTSQPTQRPTMQPSRQPSQQPTGQPSQQPSRQPSTRPTIFNRNPKAKIPTGQPTHGPSSQPSQRPSHLPSSRPSSQPSRQPSRRPSCRPTSEPISFPSGRPTMYVATPPKPTNGDITLAVALVQTTTTLSGITASQYQSSSSAFAQGFSSAMARLIDPLTTGTVDPRMDVAIVSVTPNTAVAAVLAVSSVMNSQPQQQDQRELATGTLTVIATLRATNCNPQGLAALLLQRGTDGTFSRLLKNNPAFNRWFPGSAVVGVRALDVSPTGAPFVTRAPTPLPSSSGFLVAWKIIVVSVVSAVGVGVVVLVIALYFPKGTKLPSAGASSLLPQRLDHQGVSDGDDDCNNEDDRHDRDDDDAYWTGINPALPSLAALSTNDNNSNSNMAAVIAVARNNRTHEQARLTRQLREQQERQTLHEKLKQATT